MPESELKRARAALSRARAVGEEYENVRVATATVRARRAGEAIVHEAKRRGVEAIVLAAEEPTRMRGGPLLGGQSGAARHLRGGDDALRRQQAPCRVILTAPPADGCPSGAAPGGHRALRAAAAATRGARLRRTRRPQAAASGDDGAAAGR